jgi:hypothetical protein
MTTHPKQVMTARDHFKSFQLEPSSGTAELKKHSHHNPQDVASKVKMPQ